MNPLYTVAELLAATGGRPESLAAESVFSISIDSREIAAGALFVAIRGDRFDGHDFVRKAIEAGAVAALVSEARANEFAGLPLIVVPDALEGLRDIARAARARCEGKIVAITGSAGKTSTKEAMRQILETYGRTHYSIKSFNNHWGVPLMLARMPQDTEFGVFELGMSAPEEIRPLAKLVQPHVAIITTIAPAHLENFGSIAGIARAKAEIFSGLVPGGTAIINADHDCLGILQAEASSAGVDRAIVYGFSTDAEVRISNARSSGKGMTALVAMPPGELEIKTATSGRHRLANAVAALCAVEALGLPVDSALEVLRRIGEPEGRGAAIALGTDDNPLMLIDESYNANPASMTATLETFAGTEVPRGKKIVVLGDMLELGPQSSDLHAGLEDAVLSVDPGVVFLVGQHMQALGTKLEGKVLLHSALNADEIALQLLMSLDYGDAVMVKGSNSMRLDRLVALICDRFGAAATSS